MNVMERKMWRRLAWVAVGVFGVAVAPAAGQSTTRDKAARGQPATKTNRPGDVYLQTARVFVHVDKTGLGHEHAMTGRIRQGSIRLDVDQGAGVIVFDMASFTADSDQARKYIGLGGTTDAATAKKVTANMVGSAVLDVRRYPTATFTIDSSRRLPDKSPRGLVQYKLTGKLTLHGVTRPLSFVAETEEKNGWVHLRGGFPLLQTAFGITPFTKAFGAVGVADRLTVWGDLWAVAPRQAVSRRGTPERQ